MGPGRVLSTHYESATYFVNTVQKNSNALMCINVSTSEPKLILRNKMNVVYTLNIPSDGSRLVKHIIYFKIKAEFSYDLQVLKECSYD